MSYRKKLIEVALPLEAINDEASRRKRKAPAGYPTTIHKWWAQRPLAACRAVIFASLVDDPSSRPEDFPTADAQENERQRLFRIMEELVKWENSTDRAVLAAAHAEILKSVGGNPPSLLDPFSGGASIPLEAQRLGLGVIASDLNPIAVLIAKALVELPARFGGRAPVNPEARRQFGNSGRWPGASGMAEDVRFYGAWMLAEARRRIAQLYPSVSSSKKSGGGTSPVVAWLWARTVTCPNPACGARMPLAATYLLSTKGDVQFWVEPIVNHRVSPPVIRFAVRSGKLSSTDRKHFSVGSSQVTSKGLRAKAAFVCAACRQGIATGEYIDEQYASGDNPHLAIAAVVEATGKRGYVDVDAHQVEAATRLSAEYLSAEIGIEGLDAPARGTFASNAQGRRYGFERFTDYFTPRQLAAHLTLANLISDVRHQIASDERNSAPSSVPDVDNGLSTGRSAYADAVATYLAFALSRGVDYNSSLSTWRPKDNALRSTLAKQGIQMAWDFAEANPFADSSGGFTKCVDVVARCLDFVPASGEAQVLQCDARSVASGDAVLVCTDPPYYSNVGYSDLADFLYVWLRRALAEVYPEILSTVLTPKASELVADKYRFSGSQQNAGAYFQSGLFEVFRALRARQARGLPMTVFYAFKQIETDSNDGDEDRTDDEISSTGWQTMLQGLVDAGVQVVGTWPMRTEGDNRQVGVGANALASSIVLVCRPRAADAANATRRQFMMDLRRELPDGVRALQRGSIPPVDLAQAAIGPGMGIFSRYERVIESDSSAMTVRTALALINQALDEILAEQEGEFDADTRWALTWFEQFGFSEGSFGDANTLANAKNTSVSGLVEAGIVASARGKARLLKREELPEDWDPGADRRRTVWEMTHHLSRVLDSGGEGAAAVLLAKLGGVGDVARDLAYRLYSTCERRGWAVDAQGYNALVVAWPEIARQSVGPAPQAVPQTTLAL